MSVKYKYSRINIRIKNEQKNFLIYAAALCHKKLSVFMLDSALKEAEKLTSQNTRFELPDKRWKAFCNALNKPVREIPKLKKLFRGDLNCRIPFDVKIPNKTTLKAMAEAVKMKKRQK